MPYSKLELRREVVRRSQAKRRERARKKGLCCICCIRKPDKGYRTCRECIDRVIRYEAGRNT